MGTILTTVKLRRRDVAALLLFTLAASVASMMLPTLLAAMIDRGVADQSRQHILVIGILMAVMALVTCLTNAVATVLSARISTSFAAELRQAIFYRVQEFSAADMDRFGTASLVTRSTSDVTGVQTFLTFLLRMGVMAPLMAAAGLVLSAATGGKVSSVLNTAIPLLLISAAVILVAAGRYSVAMREKLDQLGRLFLETLEGTRVIRAFNRQQTEISRFSAANADYAALMRRSGRITGALMPVIQVIFGVTTASVMGLGAHYVHEGEMEVGALIASSQYISMILMSVILLAAVVMLMPGALACAGRIAEVLRTEPSLRDGEKTAQEAPLRGTVEFRDVTFTYPGAEEPVLENISFVTGPGQVTAIIGRTGCGKSSLIRLIPRLYEVTAGHVLVNGVDVRRYRTGELRRIIGYVPQKNVLFSGDIASNLNFGNADGQERDWERAAGIACAKEFIEKKNAGYHERIAQGGTNLSGGQRQRLAIARAIMKKPQIYLFDDSFSALDLRTDRELRENLRRAAGDAAVVMVAQRISSILSADQILVLDEGRVVGRGTHEELLRSCPQYREMAELQLGREACERELREVKERGGERK